VLTCLFVGLSDLIVLSCMHDGDKNPVQMCPHNNGKTQFMSLHHTVIYSAIVGILWGLLVNLKAFH